MAGLLARGWGLVHSTRPHNEGRGAMRRFVFATCLVVAAAILIRLLAVSGGSAAAQAAAGQPVVVDLAVPSGGSERVLYLAAAQPRATVILLSGGDGMLNIDPAGTIAPGGNFLVRTRALWAAEGFAVVVPGPPNGRSLMGQRHLPAYLEALGKVVDDARSRATAPVWLIGTSQGSTAAVNGAAHL